MDFTSASFVGFLLVLGLLYGSVPRSWRCVLLVAGSYFFYWMSSGWFAVLLLASTLIAFLAARSRWRPLVVLALLMAVLIAFKSLQLLRFGWIMPLGISYYTFKLAGYLIDTHWGAIEPERRLMPFLAFSAFFPQIVGGPIQRMQSFLPQVERADNISLSTAVGGILRILLGFFKKFVIADNLGRIVTYTYEHLTSHPGAPVLFGFYGYPLQMYADFSGLTDIALGAGVLFGINAPENFNAPFLAASPSEYWRRWHMTLTQWMTDYVFTPLRMSLRNMGNLGLVVSLFVNMVLIGLWHGFYWTFALFGVVHAIYLSLDALTQKARKRFYRAHPTADRITDCVGPIITFHLIAVAFVFFRADGVASVRLLFAHLFDGFGTFSPAFLEVIEQPRQFFTVLTAALIVMECADALRRRFWMKPGRYRFPRWARWSVYSCSGLAALLTVFLLITNTQDSNPFLYAIF
jgi:alginate O-acetyltransferase complex protein AlgI